MQVITSNLLNDFSAATGNVTAAFTRIFTNVHPRHPLSLHFAVQHRDIRCRDWFSFDACGSNTHLLYYCFLPQRKRPLIDFCCHLLSSFFTAIENWIWELCFCSLKTHHRQSHLNGRVKKSKLETVLHVKQSFSKVDFVVRALSEFARRLAGFKFNIPGKMLRNDRNHRFFFHLTLVVAFVTMNEWVFSRAGLQCWCCY